MLAICPCAHQVETSGVGGLLRVDVKVLQSGFLDWGMLLDKVRVCACMLLDKVRAAQV